MAPESITLDAKDARKRLIQHDEFTTGIVVEDPLDLSGTSVSWLPAHLSCYELDLSRCPIDSLPETLQVECSLQLCRCKYLHTLPKGLSVGTLDVSDCPKLKSLPEHLCVWFLNASGCTSLLRFPVEAEILHGGVNVAGCAKLAYLPPYLGDLATLDISDCPEIRSLPSKLRVKQWVDVAGSGLTEPCEQIANCQLRWRGVPVDEKTAFRPEELTAKDCLAEKNAEVRRVMIERMGFEEFIKDAGGKRLDRDTDPGGARELIRVPLAGDEDIVCLSCFCPSTGRHYLLRVPPNIRKCHDAAAWMAGFDDPSKYQPIIET